LSSDKIGLSNAILTYANLQFATSTLPIWQLSTLPSIRTVDPAKFSLNSYVHAVDIPNLMVMPAGPLPPNPAELLDSKAMEHFLTALAGSGVEVIIFDTPPLLGLSDANILAPKVDGVLMVVDITNANKKNLKRAKAHLAQSESRVLGCVVNKQRQSRGDSAYSYYYYYTFEEEDQNKSMHNGHNPGVFTTQESWPQSQR